MSSRLMNHERALREEINEELERNKLDDEPIEAHDG